MKKISVIIPVYRVESYLDQCVQSIVDQTYSNLEIILVDDGSPDRCGKMCDSWADIDPRIKVLHKPNGGLSDARNCGLSLASGDYIGFVDSDDAVAPHFYEQMLKILENTGAQIAECAKKDFFDDLDTECAEQEPAAVMCFDAQQAIEELMLERRFHQTVWNKLYRKECVQGIWFEKGKLHEDEFFTYQVFGKADKIALCSVPYYFYRKRPGSIMHGDFTLRNLDAMQARYERYQYISLNYPSLTACARRSLAYFCIYAYQRILRSKDAGMKKTAKQMIRKCWTDLRLSYRDDLSGESLWTMKWLVLSIVSVPLCAMVRNMLRIE